MTIYSRQLKSDIRKQLGSSDFQAAKKAVSAYPARRVINALISFYCDRDALIRWRAIEASGTVVAELALNDMASARVIMRRFLWMLNDESGGIGWGVPEAMGETLALNDALCDEFNRVFLSYVQPACNFLEHPLLQRGLLWGVGRFAQTRSALVQPVLPDIAPFLDSGDPYHRAFAALVLGRAGGADFLPVVEKLISDAAEIEIYEDTILKTTSVATVSRRAVEIIRHNV